MYFALKSVKFDRNYSTGEKIPKEKIAPDMIEKLIRCGAIQEAEKQRKEEQSQEKTKAVKHPKKV